MQIGVSRRTALFSVAALPALAGCASDTAQDARSFVPSYPRTQLLIDSWIAEQRLPSALVHIKTLNARETVLHAGAVEFGADLPADANTVYRIYSMTKPVTGFAAMLLVEDGALTLDTPLGDVLPEFRNMRVMTGEDAAATRPAAAPILIRHLLTHTSGLSYYLHGERPLPLLYRRNGLFAAGRSITLREGDGAVPATLDEFGARLAQLPLAFDPGATWLYSVSLDVLGLVIQKISGEPFDRFLHRRIFAPLRMLDTGFYVPADKLGRFTTAYFRTDEGPRDIDNRASSPFAQAEGAPYGGSGLCSTAHDYARFAEMLFQGGALDGVRIARRETAHAAMSNLLPSGFDSAATILRGGAFGAGGGIVTPASAIAGETPPGAFGWGGAAGTTFWIDPANQLYVVFMTQVLNESDRIWSPLRKAVYADIAAMPQLRREPVDTISRPRRNF